MNQARAGLRDLGAVAKAVEMRQPVATPRITAGGLGHKYSEESNKKATSPEGLPVVPPW
jgi:hypothetical protein